MKKIRIAPVLLVLFALALPLAAQQPPPPAPPAGENAEPLPAKTTLWDLIKTGGWAMWPLGLCSVGLVSMVIINLRLVSRKNLLPVDMVAALRGAAQQRDVGQLAVIAQSSQSLFAKGLLPGLRKINPDDPLSSKPDMESAIAEAVSREEAQVGFWINFLSLITGVAPMIGLLGTVSGMIGAFQKIGMGGMGKPELLAGNIGEALITTAAGLTIAIPSMFAYFLFRNALSRIIRDAEGEYSAILDAIFGAHDLFAAAQEPIE